MDLHHKLYRRCVRRCFEHDVVSELQWADLNILDVFTSKKRLFPWQWKRLERQPVSLAGLLDTSATTEALRRLDALKDPEPKVVYDSYNDHLQVNHKGHLTASAEKYAHANIEKDQSFQVDIDFGKVESAEIAEDALRTAITGIRVQPKHFVLRERKPHSLYVVIKLDFAEKITLTRKLHGDFSAGAGLKMKDDIGGEIIGSTDDSEQGSLTRTSRSAIAFNCARLAINSDNTLTLLSWGAARMGIDLDETDSGDYKK